MQGMGYYIVHTFVNSVRKLFRTWVALFLVICVLFGAAVGIGAAVLMDEAGITEAETEEEVSLTPEERAELFSYLEPAAGVILLLIFIFGILSAEKNGNGVFTMADVHWLFSAPVRPQAVLLFRLVVQMGGALTASVYLLFHLPNFMESLSLTPWMAIGLLAWLLLALALSRLLSVLVYTLTKTYDRLARYVRPTLWGVVLLLAAGIALVSQREGMSLWQAGRWLLGPGLSRAVPGWGWLKGMVGCVLAQEPWMALLFAGLTLLLGGGIFWLAWRIPADFYESAMECAAKVQEQTAAAQEGRAVKREKERSDRLRRDGLTRGAGASAFFWKGVYNRHRLAHFHVLTNTGITYLVIFLLIELFGLLNGAGGVSLAVPAAVVLFCAFFRNFGNPIQRDLQSGYLLLAPEPAWKKLLFALLPGCYDTLMDVLPGLLVGVAFTLEGAGSIGAVLVESGMWLLLIVTMDLTVSCADLFWYILPSSLPQSVVAMLNFLLRFAVLLPGLGLLAGVGFAAGLSLGLLLAMLWNLMAAALLFLPVAVLFHEGTD